MFPLMLSTGTSRILTTLWQYPTTCVRPNREMSTVDADGGTGIVAAKQNSEISHCSQHKIMHAER